MGNFAFLKSKTEYSGFAGACITAENNCKNSPESCVSSTRSALESAVKWVYANDSGLSYPKSKAVGKDLFARMDNPSFSRIVPKKLLSKIHIIRRMGNDVLHKNRSVSRDEAIKCLMYLFDFIQWIDKRYGRDYIQRDFDMDDVPNSPSMLQQAGKYAAAIAVGIGIATLGKKLTDDRMF